MKILRCIAVLVLLSCSQNDPGDETDPPSDAAFDNDGNIDLGRDAVVDARTLSDVSSDGSTRLPEVMPVDTIALWETDRPCIESTLSVEAVRDGEFVKPDRPEIQLGALLTYMDFAELLGEPVPDSSNIRVDEGHEPGDVTTPYDLFANQGESVVIRTYFTEENDPDTELRFLLTLLLDYEPVEAKFLRWTQDRSATLARMTGSGFAFEANEVLSVVDIEIPAAQFDPGRMHELSLSFQKTEFLGANRGVTWRLPVFYGGYAPPASLPCEYEPADLRVTEFERETLRPRAGKYQATLFMNPHVVELYTVHDVQPGQTRRIYFTLFPQTGTQSRVVLTPTLNGEPIADAIWVASSEAIGGIPHRDFFDVTFPEEPGIYEVTLQLVMDPWVRWREFGTLTPTQGFDGVANAELRAGAYPLRFRVSADSTN